VGDDIEIAGEPHTPRAIQPSWEREIMLERQREGIAKAKAEGKYKGRKPTVAVQSEAIRMMHAAGIKPAHIARKLGIARSSVYRMLEGAP
jgi:DNA invertase Pin-like site-specific DNA recombinase